MEHPKLPNLHSQTDDVMNIYAGWTNAPSWCSIAWWLVHSKSSVGGWCWGHGESWGEFMCVHCSRFKWRLLQLVWKAFVLLCEITFFHGSVYYVRWPWWRDEYTIYNNQCTSTQVDGLLGGYSFLSITKRPSTFSSLCTYIYFNEFSNLERDWHRLI